MSAGDFHIYDSNEVSIIVAGIPVDGGFGEDEFLRVSPASDDFIDVAGTDGSVTRSKTNDRRSDIMITVMQTAAVNDAFSALRLLDINAPNGAGVGPLLVRDKSGRTLYSAAKCWIAAVPEATFKKGAEARAWKIRVANLNRFDGGS